ncbi:MAG: nicotinate-nucleotide--dimethylbenzimidazole phosphoribosyltransferase, partial [Candidatus Puniceispirillaceae bacterium]
MMSLFASSNHVIEIIGNLPNGSVATMESARERQAQLTKPPGSLGKLEDIAVWL